MTIIIGATSKLKVESALVRDFYTANWARRIALADEDFYNWQFKSLPLSIDEDNCVIAYDSDKSVIAGVMGLNARPFFLNGKKLKGAELTTWVVSEDYRKAGAGAKILAYIMGEYDALIGMGISEMALPVYLRFGFRYLSAIPRFVRVYNFDAVASISTHDPIALKMSRQWLNAKKVINYNVTEGLCEEINSLFDRLSQTYNFYDRDIQHLKWRYIEHPVFEYRTFCISSPDHEGIAFVAFRLENVVPGLTIIHVTDCIGDECAMESAFAFIDDFCCQEGADVADFYCTASLVNKYLLSQGWFSVVDDRYFKFPHLFHPVEVRSPATTSLIYWSKENFTDMCNFSNFYVTKQDADLDRPVLKGK